MKPAFSERDLAALLQRPVRSVLGESDRRAIGGRRVLVTGAGGTIGSALARELASCGVASLTLVDHSELALFEIEREIAERWPHVPIDAVLADVAQGSLLRAACRVARPQFVFHAAAYKHVTMTERAVCAAVRANVIGTAQAVRAAREAGARFVLISSDKAIAPQSVMGATKRLAERVTLACASSLFHPAVVRFGNVLGSSGSVLTIFRERIRAGLPVLVTDPDATRYFMTEREAVGLVLKATVFGGRTDVYWLDMGQPVRLGDLVERVLALEEAAGFSRVPVRVIGLRPGEKLQEQLAIKSQELCRTVHSSIWVARHPAVDLGEIDAWVSRLRRDVRRGHAASTLKTLTEAVPEFTASEHATRAAASQTCLAMGAPVRSIRVRRA